ncbi:hypothetical protein FS837_012492 [Tulasnella sp. UAMH 9824]|nr:hypothetical protein FS837_012492 [Tulasnella sp. UAMH 9824]
MALDFIILLLTIPKSFVAGSQRNAAPILATLFRDGIYCYLIAFATGLVNILFNVFGPGAVKGWMINYTGPLLSSMATRLILNLHDEVSRTAHYPANSPTTVHEDHTNAFSTVEFAPPAVTRDVESPSHDMHGGESGTNDRTDRARTGDGDEEGNAFELKALKEDGKEESTPSTGELESKGMLTVPGRRLRGTAKVDPG